MFVLKSEHMRESADSILAEFPMNFNDLRRIDVNEYIEKKNNLSYLSWAYAVDQLLQHDPTATWEYKLFDYADGQVPYCRIGETCMVFCTVNAFGISRTAQLPVMDHRNRAIANPDSFAVNTAMQRCLAKAISLHGIGLYIYAGEDVPARVETEQEQRESLLAEVKTKIHSIRDKNELNTYWTSLHLAQSHPLYAPIRVLFTEASARIKATSVPEAVAA